MTSFVKPTSDQIEATLPLLSSPQHEAYFFARLENPLWIAPLAERGVFKYPPPVEKVEGGGVRFPAWPPSRYLARMALRSPSAVAQIFANLDTDNASIVGDMLEAANAMPTEDALALVPTVCRMANDGTLWIHFKDASDLCMRLIEGGHVDAANQLAKALFTPRFGEGEKGPSRRDQHWYKEGIQKVAPALAQAQGSRFLSVLCNWLESSVRAKKHIDVESGSDYSYSWRPAIEEHDQNHDFDFAGVMVGIVRAAFEDTIRNTAISLDDALAMLKQQVFHVFSRMRVHLINEFADRQPALARETMLDRDLFDDFRSKHEYAMLVGRRWDMLDTVGKTIWLSWVDDGPDMSDFDESTKRNRGREATDEDRQSRVRWWQYERLHWISDHLSGEHRTFYEQMRQEHGEPELADLNIRIGSGWVGEKSPMSVDELSAMSFENAVDAVVDWRPDGSRFMGPSIEGLASTFKQYVATDRVGFSSRASALKGRPAIFVRSFVSEMAEAVKAGGAIDVASVVALCQWVVEQPVEERTVPKQDDEMLVDKDWQWARDEASEFAEAVCKAQAESRPKYPLDSLRDPIWNLINTLCRDRAASYVVHDFSKDDPRVHDYLHLGINSPRGKAMEAALEYARWVGNHLKVVGDGQEVVPGGFDVMPEVRDMLAWQIEPANRTYEAMSIVGSRVGVLYWIDRDWLEANADTLFDLQGVEQSPPAAQGWAAWNAFLVWVRPHFEFYRRLKRQFSYAVDHAATVKLADRGREQPMNHLGEHLMILYGRGQLGLDDDGGVLRRFIETANPDIRRHAIGFVGRSLEGDDELPEDVLRRFMSLWELYWEGRGQQDAREAPDAWLFGTWFGCGKFPPQWSIDRLREFAEVAPVVEPDHSVVERLAEIVDTDILTATRILDRIVRGDKEGWRASGWRESAETILERAMNAGGDARAEAENLINYLGRRGYIELGKLLKPST